MTIRVEHADMLQAIPRLVAEGVGCDAVVTDPPYHLTAIAERSKYPVKYGKDGAMQRLLGGFMNQTWDGGDIAFRPETWATVATILRPGAFLVAFGGTRTHHRLACAIEDAGFVIQDTLMWLFATGFPKRRDMLKPAFEPIVLAYKPGGKRTMQVDECRIETAENLSGGAYSGGQKHSDDATSYFTGIHAGEYQQPLGRWPANICHDGSGEVVACFPQSAGQQGDVRGTEPSRPGLNCYGEFGPRKPFAARGKRPGGFGDVGAERGDPMPNGPLYADNGSAARFFFSAKAGAEHRWGSKHPTVKPVDLIAWLVKLVTPPGGTFLDPFAGSGTAAVAALQTGRNAILIEREAAYVADIRERIAFYEGGGLHSSQAKNRNRKVDHGPLFAPPALTPEEDATDSLRSYDDAMRAIGERVKAGAPVPEFLLARRAQT
jgi:site-specific DNA-methyltransferase (adenine-specific)